MSDNTNTNATATTAAPTVTPVKPETWEQKAWDALQEAEQWVVSDLHEAGYIFANDVWPAIKAAFTIFGSQLFPAIFAAISANITDPALIAPAVGAAIVLTASTQGVVDAKTAVASAQAAVAADPTVQALIANNT